MKKNILNRRAILKQLGLGGHLFVITIFMICLIVSILFICKSVIEMTNLIHFILNIILGGALLLFSLYIIVDIIVIIVKILKKDYIIVLDDLMDKYYYRDFPRSEVDNSAWYLYLKNYFKLYNKTVKTRHLQKGYKYKVGDKFYLVFIKGKHDPFIFEMDKYELGIDEQKKFKTFDEAKDYIRFKKFTIKKKDNNEKVIVDKKCLIKDFLDRKRVLTAIILLVICLFIIVMIIATWAINLFATILEFILLLVFCLVTVINISHTVTTVININKNRYIVKKDKIVSINEGLRYKESNSLMLFKFENYRSIIPVPQKYYNLPQVGDEFYLIFVKGSKEPVKIYDVKNSILNLNN